MEYKIESKITFKPVFYPGTIVTTTETGIKWVVGKPNTEIDSKAYLKDIAEIMNFYYIDPYIVNKQDFTLFTQFCFKYGCLFNNDIDGEMTFGDFWEAIYNMKLFILWKFDDKNEIEFVNEIIKLLEIEYSDERIDPNILNKITLYLTPMMVNGKHGWHINCMGRPPVKGEFQAENNNYPIFQIKCDIHDLKYLQGKHHTYKAEWFKQKRMEILANLINKVAKYNMIVVDGCPIIESIINNHIIYFTLKAMTDSKSFNFCKKCGNLVFGKSYCSKKCNDNYNKSDTNEGKLRNLVNQWFNRYEIPYTEDNNEWIEIGVALLEELDYKEAIKKLRELKLKKFL